MKNKIAALILCLAMAFSFCIPAMATEKSVTPQASSAFSTQAESEVKTLIVEMQEGEENAESNFYALHRALCSTDGETPLVVKIAEAGTYYLSSGDGNGRGIHIRSNTTLDLNGATLVRWGGMTNLVQVADENDERKTGGYSLGKNITIQNGTLDGKGGTTEPVNLVNIGHTTNFNLLDVTLRTCLGGHLVELAGCENSTIKNCVFYDYIPTGNTKEPGEAIQLDICYNGAGTWNGIYATDGTVCKNITVEGCTFKDYPVGVGNHHTLDGTRHNTGITIKNNQFINTIDYKTSDTLPAIWCYGFDNSTVSGNTITGKYTHGIFVSGGSTSLKNNTIGSEKSPVSYIPVMITKSSANKYNSGTTRIDEYVTGGTVSGNKIYTKTDKECAISVFSKSKLSALSSNTIVDNSTKKYAVALSAATVSKMDSNTIKSAGQQAVRISSGSNVTSFSKNKLTASKEWGLYVTGSTVKTISGNTISAKQGIDLCSTSKATTISNNKITASGTYGLYLSKSGTTSTVISGNTVTAKAGIGIYLTGSKAKTIEKNTIGSPKKYGIGLSGSSAVTNLNTNTVTSSGADSIYITSSTATNIKNNVIKSSKTNGITVSSSGKFTTMTGNKVSSCKATGIVVNNKGLKKVTVNKNQLTGNKKPLNVKAKGTIQKK